MLLGIEAGIPDYLYDQFNLTGTSHTIVISGMNVWQTASVQSSARNIVLESFDNLDKPDVFVNGDMGSSDVQQACLVDNDKHTLLKVAVQQVKLSERA